MSSLAAETAARARRHRQRIVLMGGQDTGSFVPGQGVRKSLQRSGDDIFRGDRLVLPMSGRLRRPGLQRLEEPTAPASKAWKPGETRCITGHDFG